MKRITLIFLIITAVLVVAVYAGLDAKNGKVVNVADPTDLKDAANKEYVDGVAAAPGHTILGGAHGDSTTDDVTRGSIIYGNSTPAWDELTIGANQTFLKSDGTDAAWSIITLGTNTSGNYVASITDGLAIDGGDGGSEGAALTIAFDPTELLGNRTWGDASTDTIVWTWDRATGTDPTMTFGNDFISLNGDLKVLGDDLFMTTNTNRFVLMGDGTNYNPEAIDLGTDTAGNYVKDVADGTGIDGTASGEGATYTPTFDATELDALTWDAGSLASIAWTWNLSAGDPTITFGNDLVTISNSLTVATGKNIKLGTTQWNSSDEIDGTKIKDADYGDIDVSAGGAWTLDTDVVAVAEFLGSQDWGDMSTAADGTVSLDAGVVADNEIDYTAVTLADITDDVGYLKSDGSVALAGAWNMGSQATTNVNIDSGTIDGITSGATIGNLTLANGSITDSSGAISFGDENLTTTGTGTVSDVIIDDAGNIGSASDTDAIAIAADGKTTFTQDLTVNEDIITGDAKYIGSSSFPTAIQIEADGDVVLDERLTISERFDLYGSDGAQPLFSVNSYSNTAWHGASFLFNRSRGTFSSKLAVQDNDAIFRIDPKGWDGDSQVIGAGIRVLVDGSVSDGIVPMETNFWGMNSSGSLAVRMVIRASGRIGVNVASPAAMFDIDQSSASGAIPVLRLDQGDVDDSFINYVGTSAADQTKSISTVNGDGSVEGPKNFSASAGWQFEGMTKIEVNGVAYWTPYYSADVD